MFLVILWLCAGLLIITSVGLLISRDWRWSLGFLAIQYFALFGLIYSHWPLSMSASVLVVGWMAVAVLGMTQLNIKDAPAAETSWPQGRLFRVFASALVLLADLAALPALISLLPNGGTPVIFGALVLISLGLLHLGMTLQPLRVILGLFTALAGFEVLFSAIENSILVAGLLAMVTLGLALTGSYLLILDNSEKSA
jgi:hydrogenase-4 membrane subunit HyfE